MSAMGDRVGRAPRLLVVEDRDVDVELLVEALDETLPAYVLDRCADGASTIELLDEVRAGRRARPDLVLLDLDLPGIDGCEILRSIKRDERLRGTPVVILSTSAADHDIERCLGDHANSYVVKAPSFSRFLADVDAIVRYWLDVTARPAC